MSQDKLNTDTEYLCTECLAETFPFTNTSTSELLIFECLNRRSSSKLNHPDQELLNLKDLSFSKNKKYVQNYLDENLAKFDFYNLHEFHNLKNKPGSSSEAFNIKHKIICFLEGKFDKLEFLLHNLGYNFDVVALTKIWHVEGNKTFAPDTMEIIQNI